MKNEEGMYYGITTHGMYVAHIHVQDDPEPPKKKCNKCGKYLSMYNKGDECWAHSGNGGVFTSEEYIKTILPHTHDPVLCDLQYHGYSKITLWG